MSSTTDFHGGRNVIFYFSEFVVGVDKGNFETTLVEKANDLVESIDNVFGATLICDAHCLLLDSSADFIERENTLKFDDF